MKTIMGFFTGLRSILWPYADTPTAESVQDSLVATERQTNVKRLGSRPTRLTIRATPHGQQPMWPRASRARSFHYRNRSRIGSPFKGRRIRPPFIHFPLHGNPLFCRSQTKPTHPARRGFVVLFNHTKLTQIVFSQQRVKRLRDVEIPCAGITPSPAARRIAAIRTFAVGHASG